MSDAGKAVFLSYASQDAEAAKRICDALRGAGVEVWFDQSELVGGDAWDQKIRRQIKECALLIPVISANTQARREGYFRLEWRLAVERMRQMDDDLPFLLPVVIDDTKDGEAFVPEKFREVQWTRLQGGETSPVFCARIQRLLEGGGGRPESGVRPSRSVHAGHQVQPPAARARWPWLVGAIAALMIGFTAWMALRSPQADRTIGSNEGANPKVAVVTAKSPARQLADKALVVALTGTATHEQLRGAAGIAEKAAMEDPLDGEIWAIGALVDLSFYELTIDASEKRRDAVRVKLSQAKGLAPRAPLSRYAEAKTLVRIEPMAAGLKAAEGILREMLAVPPPELTRENVMSLLVSVLAEQHRFAEAARLAEDAGLWSGAFWSYLKASDLAQAASMAERQTKVDQANGLYLQMIAQFARGDLEAWAEVQNRVPATARLEELMLSQQLWLAYYRRDAAALLAAARRFPTAYIETSTVKAPRGYFIGIAHQWSGQAEAARAAWTDALQEVERRLAVDPKVGHLRMARMWQLACLDRKDEASQALADFRLQNQDLWMESDINGLLILLDRQEEALDQLEKLLRANPRQYWHLHTAARYAPIYDPLRGNARFEKLLRETLLPGAKPFDNAQGRPFDDPKPLTEARQLVERAAAIWGAAARTFDQFAAAEQLCAQAVKLDPNDGLTWAAAARVDAMMVSSGFDLTPERRQQALKKAARAVALAPSAFETRFAQAYAFSFAGDSPVMRTEAVRIFRLLLQERPADRNTMINLGTTLRDLGQYDEASILFERTGSLSSLGWNYYTAGRFEEAARVADRMLARERTAAALQLKSQSEWARGNLDAAQAAVDLFAPDELLKENFLAQGTLVGWARGDYDRIIQLLNAFPQEFLDVNGFNGPKRLLTGLAHEKAGRLAAAQHERQTALRQVDERLGGKSTDLGLMVNRALLLACLGEKDEAERTLRLVQELSASSFPRFSVLQAQLRLGHKEEVLATLEKDFGEKRQGWLHLYLSVLRLRLLDPLHNDPRFEKLMRDNLPPGVRLLDEPNPGAKP